MILVSNFVLLSTYVLFNAIEKRKNWTIRTVKYLTSKEGVNYEIVPKNIQQITILYTRYNRVLLENQFSSDLMVTMVIAHQVNTLLPPYPFVTSSMCHQNGSPRCCSSGVWVGKFKTLRDYLEVVFLIFWDLHVTWEYIVRRNREYAVA